LLLANSCSRAAFPKICASNGLLSQAQVAQATSVALEPGIAESVLGTADYVFLYVGSFRYPGTACGLLFKPSLEEHRQQDSCASPFDTGGLVRHMVLPDPSETPLAFHLRHELPVPAHRKVLALTIDLCFGHPTDYLSAVDATHLPRSPFGITDGDLRRYTHEVRIPQSVPLRSQHLEAAFVAGLLGESLAVEDFAEWCLQNGIHYQRFLHPGEGDFNALRREAMGYVMQNLQ
jgi:hypothetical protein